MHKNSPQVDIYQTVDESYAFAASEWNVLQAKMKENKTHLESSSARGSSGSGSLVGRMRGLRQDVQKRISRLRPNHNSSDPSPPSPPQPSSPSTSASPGINGIQLHDDSPTCNNTNASGSNRSSLSGEEPEQIYSGPFLGKARALVDCIPSPYDRDALRFKKGDVIDIIEMKPSGLWKGRFHNRVGYFKFINVEIIQEKQSKHKSNSKIYGRRKSSKRGRPKSVEELLQRIGLEEHISVFVLNGYEDLDLFKDLEEGDLDYLGISIPEHRVKLLTAVELLHDYDSSDTPETDDPTSSTDGSASQCEVIGNRVCGGTCNFQRLQFPRDSGCYGSNDEHSNRLDFQKSAPNNHTVETECCTETRTQNDTHSEGANNLDSCVTTGRLSEDSVFLENGRPITHICKKIISREVLDQELPAHFNIPVGLDGYRNKAQATIADFEAKFLRQQMNNRQLHKNKDEQHAITDSFTENGGPRSLSSDSSGRAGSEKSSDSGISTSSRSPPSLPRHPRGVNEDTTFLTTQQNNSKTFQINER